MVSLKEYFGNVWDTLRTTAVGMRITGKYLLQKPITVQYPDERMPIPDRYRGIHYLEQEKCINCLACARACPIDCIEMDAIRHGKELEWVKFTLDYQKCMFCELCVYPCPKDCIHMGTEFALVTYDRSELDLDLLSFKGMAREAKLRMREAEKKKAAKEAAKAAKAAGAPETDDADDVAAKEAAKAAGAPETDDVDDVAAKEAAKAAGAPETDDADDAGADEAE